jgi:hypothetical protein
MGFRCQQGNEFGMNKPSAQIEGEALVVQIDQEIDYFLLLGRSEVGTRGTHGYDRSTTTDEVARKKKLGLDQAFIIGCLTSRHKANEASVTGQLNY